MSNLFASGVTIVVTVSLVDKYTAARQKADFRSVATRIFTDISDQLTEYYWHSHPILAITYTKNRLISGDDSFSEYLHYLCTEDSPYKTALNHISGLRYQDSAIYADRLKSTLDYVVLFYHLFPADEVICYERLRRIAGELFVVNRKVLDGLELNEVDAMVYDTRYSDLHSVFIPGLSVWMWKQKGVL